MLTTAVQSTSVDWLTGYCKAEDDEKQALLAEQAFALECKEVERGNEIKTFSMRGFKGTCIGGVGIAYNEAGDLLLRLSGHCAGESALGSMLIGARPSRLDLQVTTVTGRKVEEVAVKAARDSSAESARARNPWHTSYITSMGRGDTVYIGSMKSAMYCRVYDKELESRRREYTNCWRYELVIRDEYAVQAGRALLKAQFPHYLIQSTVHDWLTKRGVKPLFDRGATQPVLFDVPPDTDIESKLRWVEKAVTPLLRRAVAAGYEKRVAELVLQSGILTSNPVNDVVESTKRDSHK